MNQHKRRFGSYAAGLLLMTAVTAFACKFDPNIPPPPCDALFAGTVTSMTVVTNGYALRRLVTFHVIETWKGTNTVTQSVLTGLGGGDCGYPFKLGEDYVVYALTHAGNLHTDIALPTRPLWYAIQVGDNLGEGQKSDVPLLKVASNAGGMALSWRTNWNNFHIETSETMEAGSWQRLTNDVQTSGHYYVTTNAMTASRRFFRLAR
jgi:hypothetical protein